MRYLHVCLSVCVSYLDILVQVFSLLLTCSLLGNLELSPLQGKVPAFLMTLGENAFLFFEEVLLSRGRGSREGRKEEGWRKDEGEKDI